jgi:hypothetical protein
MGNSNYGKSEYYSQISWAGFNDAAIDIRLFFSDRLANSWSKCRWIEGEANPGLNFYR